MTPIVLCIDVEPDLRVFDRDQSIEWIGFERLLLELPALRDLVATRTGVLPRFTWFLRMDPQIADTWGSPRWLADRYGADLAALEAAGDELGAHIHTWRWSEGVRSWIAEREDREWVERCTTMSLDAFEASFGRPCRSHRGGDRFLSAEMLSLLVARGVSVDLTAEPGVAPAGPLDPREFARGTTPDYRDMPIEPYHPRSTTDFVVPGSAEPLMLPLFSSAVGPTTRAPLYLWIEPAAFAEALDRTLADGVPRALVFAIRSDLPVLPDWPSFVTNLERLASHPMLEHGEFMTASEAAAVLSWGSAAPARPVAPSAPRGRAPVRPRSDRRST